MSASRTLPQSRISVHRSLPPLLALAFLVVSTPLLPRAEEQAGQPAGSSAKDAEQEEEIRSLALEERVSVTAARPVFESVVLDRASLEAARFANLAQAFRTLPGIAAIGRTPTSLEPVIRGLGWERVQTQVNGMPLHGACAARMDPPSVILGAVQAQAATAVKGLSSVTLGPGGTGGRLLVSTEYRRSQMQVAEWRPWSSFLWDGPRQGLTGAAGVRGGAGGLDLSAGAQTAQAEDYVSPSGVEVPSGMRETDGFLDVGFSPTGTVRWSASALLRETEDVDFPSLPMDTEWDRSRIYSSTFRYDPAGGSAFRGLDVRAGLALVDHAMSNRNKPNRLLQEADSLSSADTVSASLTASWSLSRGSALAVGVDSLGLDRDAVRQRTILAKKTTFRDHLWPDVSQDDIGVFAEYSHALPDGWRVRLGVRHDDVSSEAGAADDASLGGLTVRGNYARFYGAGAVDTDRSERHLSGNLLVGRDMGRGVTVEGGIGITTRAASVTERYFAFAPAPARGGRTVYLVGNPALDAETKREASAGVEWNPGRTSVALTVFRFDFDDYINPVVLALQDADLDGTANVIQGFANVRARIVGAEVAVVLWKGRMLSVPVSLAYVRGNNRDAGAPLPEMPPLEGRIAARCEFDGGLPGWVEIGGRINARQARIDAAFGEDPTAGFAVWHLRGAVTLARRLRIEAGVENLFDREYHEHLAPEAAMTVGGLSAGDEIPSPGRSLVLSARWDF